MTEVQFEHNGSFNDWRFRYIVLPNKVKALLVSGVSNSFPRVGITVVNAGTLSQATGSFPQLSRLVALALDHEDIAFPEKSQLRQAFEKRDGCSETKTQPDFSSFHSVVRDTDTNLRVALSWMSSMLNEPSFPVEKLTETWKEINESLVSELAYDEGKRVDFLQEYTTNPNNFPKYGADGKECSPPFSEAQLRDEVVSYFETHYIPSSMYAIVQGSQSLEELQKMVEETLGEIQNKNAEPDISLSSKHLYGPLQCGTMMVQRMVPIDDDEDNTFILKFHVPTSEMETTVAYAVGTYINRMLERDRSLVKILKENNEWVRSTKKKYSTDVTFPSSGCLCLEFKMKLTETGMQNVDGIVGHIIAYIRFLEAKGFQDWFWEETKIQKIFYRRMFNNYIIDHDWAETALKLLATTNSSEYAIKSIYGTHLIDKFDENELLGVLGGLAAKNARIILLSKSFDEVVTHNVQGIEYHEEEISGEVIEIWNSIQDGSLDLGLEFEMPSPSMLIPSPQEIRQQPIDENQNNEGAKQIQTNMEFSRIWFLQNNNLDLPQVYFRVELSSPTVTRDPKSILLNNMYWFLLDDHCVRSYGRESGLYPQLEETSSGQAVYVDWFTATIGQAITDLIKLIDSFVPDEKSFKSIRFSRIAHQKNILQSDGASYFGRSGEILLTPLITPRDNLAILKEITYADMVNFVKQFHETIILNWLVYGKIASEEVIKIVEGCEKIFTSKRTKVADGEEITRKRQIQIPQGTKWAHTYETDTDAAVCTTIYFQNVQFDPKSNVLVQFLSHLLNMEAIEILQSLTGMDSVEASTEQLYSPDARKNLYIYVDSADESPDVESRIDKMLLQFHKILESMDELEFIGKRNAFLGRLWNPLHHDKLVNQWFEEIKTGSLCNFSRCEEYAKALETVELAEFVTFVEEFVGITPGKMRRFTLMVGKGPDTSKLEESRRVEIGSENVEAIIDLNEWINGSNLVPVESNE